jgi:hypothetical protein
MPFGRHWGEYKIAGIWRGKMRLIISKKFFICSMFVSLIFSSHAEQFKLSNKVIKTKISYQNLNRLSIKGDKIDSIVGIDSAFHLEKNEKTGEAFIRPTEDNGYAPISLSLTTISGRTQDLLLEPVEGEANSIELISEAIAHEDLSSLLDFPTSEESSSGNDYEETVSAVMKKFINLPTNFPAVEVRNITGRSYQHLKAKFESAYLIDGFLCLKFKIITEKDGVFVLDERMFSRKGDVALSLSDFAVGKNSRATLYILRK